MMEPGTLSDLQALSYAGQRLSDTVFWTLPLLALLCCAVHAARRAFRQPTPAAKEASPPEREET